MTRSKTIFITGARRVGRTNARFVDQQKST